MGILKSAADLVYTIRFLKLLVTPWEETGAYKAGIINADGSRNKDFNTNDMRDRDAYSTHYTMFHRLVYNIKRLMSKIPGGQSTIARYGAALWLIKEHGNLKDEHIEKIHKETGIDILDVLAEDTQWFMIEGDKLSPGVYRMKNDTITSLGAEMVGRHDQIRVHEEKNAPVGEVLGIKIYEATHLKTNQRIYISTGEILR
jgi:hypothetical protein